MQKTVINTYIEGMNKDIDLGLISNKAYLEANNFRLVTTQGSTTGSLENIRGNKSIISTTDMLDETDTYTTATEYFVLAGQIIHDGINRNAGDFFTTNGTTVAKQAGYTGIVRIVTASTRVEEDQMIIGGVEIRDKVVLFTTDNTSATPTTSKSCIYTLELDLDDEEQTSLTKVYDDTLNEGLSSSDFLNFSALHPIKVIARYENENIQKVYWTDGYNYLRYADVGKNLTVSGEAYAAGNRYQSVDKFNMIPNLSYDKPVLSSIINGSLNPGMFQYTYQLYRVNGSETTYSPLSNIIHITESNDYASTDYDYEGSSDVTVNSGKGIRLKISNSDNTGFDRARLIRIYYPTLNATPSVSIVAEREIATDGSDFYLNDVGESSGELTPAQITVAQSELFIAQDIATKDNRLFATNIETDYFDIGDYDSRVVRFRKWVDTGAGSDTINFNTTDYHSNITAVDASFYAFDFTISSFSTTISIPTTRDATDVTAIVPSQVYIEYTDGSGDAQTTTSTVASVTAINYDPITDTLTFTVTADDKLYTTLTSVEYVSLGSTDYTYSYNLVAAGTTVTDARVYDEDITNEVTITVPGVDTLASWDSAGWENYDTDHDGINIWNDPDNEYLTGAGYDTEVQYIYQRDGTTVGAEGPNITLGLTTEDFTLDKNSATSNRRYYSIQDGSTDNPSFENYSSPWMTGERSFQRGEVYRASVVFHNTKGQKTFPQWLCDFKMPSIRDTGYTHELVTAGETMGRNLYPTIYFKNFPTDAVSAQVYVVPREAEDRSVYTQGLAVPFDTSSPREPEFTDTALTSTIFKLVSPEILINQTVRSSSSDYVEYLGTFDSDQTAVVGTDYRMEKLHDLTPVVVDEDNKADVDDSLFVNPSTEGELYSVGGISCVNYNYNTHDAYGSTGLIIDHGNASWSALTNHHALINYRKNVFESQYGGNTYEARTYNYYRPCSDILTATETSYTCKGGDTFISYFDVSTMLFDLQYGDGASEHETVYIPVESSINLNLRHDLSVNRLQFSTPDNWFLIQEVAGDWEDATATPREYSQAEDLYQYNSVYSQLDTLGWVYAKPLDWEENTGFDTMIKSSETKVNGELADSWTSFLTNEFIEVDSTYGPVNAIYTFNNNLYYFQDRGIGVVSVNPRSLIQDSSGSDLVLGTGGVLDRYDYISQHIGCMDRDSVIKSKTSMYWFDRMGRAIYQLGESVLNLTKAKYMQSHVDNYYKTNHRVIAGYDKGNDEMLFTFYLNPLSEVDNNYENSYTLSFSELVSVFPSFYSMVPTIYIPYKNRLLTTTDGDNLVPETGNDLNVDEGLLYLHDSKNVDRCYFWSQDGQGLVSDWFVDSNVEVVFNPEYAITKVFDNITFIANAWNRTNITGGFQDNTSYNEFFDTMQFYNDYQNTGEATLVYNTNLRRRERGWSTYIPRNVVSTDVSSDPNIFTATDSTRKFKERMRGKYLIGNFTYNNGATHDKFVASDIVMQYRKSFR